MRKPRKRKNSALVPYDVDQREIDQIKGDIVSITDAARNTLPKAIQVGEWFVRQKVRLGHGDWEGWLGLHFADTSKTTIRYCVQLASEKQFLLAKFGFGIANAGDLNGSNKGSPVDVDIKKLPSIRSALKAITEKNAPIRVRKGAKYRPRKGAEGDKPIDVQVEVKSSNPDQKPSGDVFDPDRAVRIPPPPETIVEMQEKGETVEDPETPLDHVGRKMLAAIGNLNSAIAYLREAGEIAETNAIPVSELRPWIKQLISVLAILRPFPLSLSRLERCVAALRLLLKPNKDDENS